MDELVPIVDDELSRLATNRLDHTFQLTAIVHEVYLKLIEQNTQSWKSCMQFFTLPMEIMRQILVD